MGSLETEVKYAHVRNRRVRVVMVPVQSSQESRKDSAASTQSTIPSKLQTPVSTRTQSPALNSKLFHVDGGNRVDRGGSLVFPAIESHHRPGFAQMRSKSVAGMHSKAQTYQAREDPPPLRAGPYQNLRHEAYDVAAQLEKAIQDLNQNAKDTEDFVIQWTDTRIDACLAAGEGAVACAPLELLGTFRSRVLDKIKSLMRKLKAKSLQLQDAVPAPVSTKEVERSKSHTSVTNKAQDPKQKNFRSAAMGYEVQLSQALNSSGATPSSRLKACLDTISQLGHDMGSYEQLINSVMCEMKGLLFAGGLHEFDGCVLERLQLLEDLQGRKKEQIHKMEQQLERMALPKERFFETECPEEYYENYTKEKEGKMSVLATAVGRETFVMDDEPANNDDEDNDREGEARIGGQLARLSDNFAALSRLRRTATATHILTSIKMSLLMNSSSPKPADFIMHRLVEDLQAHVPGDVMNKATPALEQVMEHFLQKVSTSEYGALNAVPDDDFVMYELTEKFSYDSLELVSTLEMIFHQAFSEILEVTTDKEVQFLLAKARNNQKLIENKEKQINKLENTVYDYCEKQKMLENIIVGLKAEVKEAANGYFKEHINLRDQNILAEEERQKREEEKRIRESTNVKRTMKDAFAIEAKKAQVDKMEEKYITAINHIQSIEAEMEKLTPRYLTSGRDGTVERIKEKLMGEGVFLKGKKNTHETLVFVLDLLHETKKELKHVKSTLETIQENGGAGDVVDNTAVQYHSGLGMGDNIPVFMRWRGKVKYHLIGKKEAETIVRQVWAEREKNQECSFSEHFHQFLTTRYPDEAMAVEWAYNLIHALEQFKWDADCTMFLKIVREELPEVMADYESENIETFQACIRLAVNKNLPRTSMSQEEFITIIRRAYPMKSEQDLHEMSQALVASVGAGNNDFDPESIFEETEDLSETPVVEGLRAQYILDLENFRCQVEDTVRANAETGPDGIQVITARKAREALRTTDSMKPTEQINEWIAHGMNLPVDDMHDEDVALLDEFSKRLKGLMLQPTLPPNQYLEKARAAKLNLKQDAKARKKEALAKAKKT